jgi:hypothetical protein
LEGVADDGVEAADSMVVGRCTERHAFDGFTGGSDADGGRMTLKRAEMDGARWIEESWRGRTTGRGVEDGEGEERRSSRASRYLSYTGSPG